MSTSTPPQLSPVKHFAKRLLFRPRDQWGIGFLVVIFALLLSGRLLWQKVAGTSITSWDAARSKADISIRIDINQADWPELALLPQIGEALAKRIVEDRQRRGPFTAPQDLARVKGIGPKTLADLLPYLSPLEEQAR